MIVRAADLKSPRRRIVNVTVVRWQLTSDGADVYAEGIDHAGHVVASMLMTRAEATAFRRALTALLPGKRASRR